MVPIRLSQILRVHVPFTFELGTSRVLRPTLSLACAIHHYLALPSFDQRFDPVSSIEDLAHWRLPCYNLHVIRYTGSPSTTVRQVNVAI
jgi:hypothetical protein